MKFKMQTIERKIVSTIHGRRCGKVISPADFTRIGTRVAVAQALHRLVQNGTLKNIARGLYLYRQVHPVLGELSPTPDDIANAIAARDRTRLQPTGAYAANLLGLSEQVPVKFIFLTDGVSRTVRIGNTTIQLKRTTPRNMATAGKLSGLVIQALRSFGRAHVAQEHIDHLKRTLPAEERRKLLKDEAIAPAWMRPILRELAES